MKVVDYMAQRGVDEQQLADLLELNVRGVRGMKNREMPVRWCEKLGVPFDAEAAGAERERFVQTREQEDQPPRPHDDGAVRDAPRPLLPATAPDSSVARERIASLYGGLGFALTARTGNRGYQAVVDDQAPHVADAWLKAAEENEFARRVVAMMSAGGATGELVMAHAVMVMGLAYVSGRSDFDPLGSFARKYGQHRAFVRVDAEPAEPAPEDGAGVDHSDSATAVG